ncbi:MAG: hypothetical protein FWG87_04145 [Defluviitaleaceae bacterium]|nr:hypothetical protein [Defluviitaleaceae bacterium]
MSKVSELLLKNTEAWVATKSGFQSAAANEDNVGAELKAQWLQVVDDMKKGEGGEHFAKFVSEIETNQDSIREEIGKLLYGGKLDNKSLTEVLHSHKSVADAAAVAAANGCYVCTACTACVACGMCALCVITGVAAASVTGSISVTSTVSAVS